MLQSPKVERGPRAKSEEGGRKKMKSSLSSGGTNDNGLSSSLTVPVQLDCTLAKERVRGPPGRRLPRKSQPNIHKSSHEDLLNDEDGKQQNNGQMLRRNQRAKSLCLLDSTSEDAVPDDVPQIITSVGTPRSGKSNDSVEVLSCDTSVVLDSNNTTNNDTEEVDQDHDHDDDDDDDESFSNLNFERAWFLRFPSVRVTNINNSEELTETTSDYFSMHETNNSSSSSTPTNNCKQHNNNDELNGARNITSTTKNKKEKDPSSSSNVCLLTYSSHKSSMDADATTEQSSSSPARLSLIKTSGKSKWLFCSVL